MSAIAAFGRKETARDAMDWNARAAVQRLGLDASMATILSSVTREVRLDIPLSRDNSKTAVLKGFHVEHNSARGPALAFLTPQSTLNVGESRALAQSATWTAAVANVPFGGAVAAVEGGASALSPAEREHVVRQYVRQLSHLLGPYTNLLAPDGSFDRHAAKWANDEFSRVHGAHTAAILGKSRALGGAVALDEARAIGVCAVLRESVADGKKPISGLRVCLHGSGHVTEAIARAMRELGCKVESCGDEQRMFASECDVLVAAGAPCSLNGADASLIRARLVIEAASLVCTPSADLMLDRRGISVVPDLVAAAGATVAAFVEWDQNLQKVCRTNQQVRDEIDGTVVQAWQNVRDRREREKWSLRSAAYAIAVERVARVERLRQGC